MNEDNKLRHLLTITNYRLSRIPGSIAENTPLADNKDSECQSTKYRNLCLNQEWLDYSRSIHALDRLIVYDIGTRPLSKLTETPLPVDAEDFAPCEQDKYH